MIPIAIIAIINTITAMIIITPTADIRSTVPQYLQRLAWELTIFPQLRHLICFTFFFNYILTFLNKHKAYKSPLCSRVFYIPSIAFFSFGSSVCSPSQIEKTAFLNSSPGIVPFISLFM